LFNWKDFIDEFSYVMKPAAASSLSINKIDMQVIFMLGGIFSIRLYEVYLIFFKVGTIIDNVLIFFICALSVYRT